MPSCALRIEANFRSLSVNSELSSFLCSRKYSYLPVMICRWVSNARSVEALDMDMARKKNPKMRTMAQSMSNEIIIMSLLVGCYIFIDFFYFGLEFDDFLFQNFDSWIEFLGDAIQFTLFSANQLRAVCDDES